eukprot:9472836-Pyramimonas_sp.AAC.1
MARAHAGGAVGAEFPTRQRDARVMSTPLARAQVGGAARTFGNAPSGGNERGCEVRRDVRRGRTRAAPPRAHAGGAIGTVGGAFHVATKRARKVPIHVARTQAGCAIGDLRWSFLGGSM